MNQQYMYGAKITYVGRLCARLSYHMTHCSTCITNRFLLLYMFNSLFWCCYRGPLVSKFCTKEFVFLNYYLFIFYINFLYIYILFFLLFLHVLLLLTSLSETASHQVYYTVHSVFVSHLKRERDSSYYHL